MSKFHEKTMTHMHIKYSPNTTGNHSRHKHAVIDLANIPVHVCYHVWLTDRVSDLVAPWQARVVACLTVCRFFFLSPMWSCQKDTVGAVEIEKFFSTVALNRKAKTITITIVIHAQQRSVEAVLAHFRRLAGCLSALGSCDHTSVSAFSGFCGCADPVRRFSGDHVHLSQLSNVPGGILSETTENTNQKAKAYCFLVECNSPNAAPIRPSHSSPRFLSKSSYTRATAARFCQAPADSASIGSCHRARLPKRFFATTASPVCVVYHCHNHNRNQYQCHSLCADLRRC